HAAHALHYMGVLEERRGNRDRADEFFRRAHETDPETIPLPYRISPEEFDRLVEEAISELPGKVRRYLSNVAIAVEDYPQESQFGGDETVTPSVLGVFTGSPLGEKGTFDPWSHFPNNIILFQRNLENSVGSREELVEEIGITLLHEVGHFLGLDEDELRERAPDRCAAPAPRPWGRRERMHSPPRHAWRPARPEGRRARPACSPPHEKKGRVERPGPFACAQG